MKSSSRLSAVLHALMHMAAHRGPMTSEVLAQCMSTHPVVVRRTMSGLREAGLVTSTKGHNGGWSIACDMEKTTIRDIHEALGEPAVYAIANSNDAPQCLLEQAVNAALDDAMKEAEALLLARFQSLTLAQIAGDFTERLRQRHRHKDH
ncbi:Rrf2 family transcriptional regulator [Pelagibacterium limicola]|uniref:Rrf2 family transcriptional regulator n=1 Tax=Pelagibacterium limicola TaxID=2791022 RepID=UPI0018AFFE0C|nr:Rrf2 family transcriptional regulator [Pelagibacterium limicola]